MAQPISIQVTRLPHGADLPLPGYQTPHAAGMDLVAAVAEDKSVTLKPLERFACPCGFAMALPLGYEAQIRPRSGLALKQGLSMPNSPGTIDADYRGEIKVILINFGQEPVTITRGMRIAQMVIAKVEAAAWAEVAELSTTDRGSGGFGSTGH